MRDFGKILSSVWRSRRFRALPSDDARYFYFYLHTSKHGNQLGCFELDPIYAQADMVWPLQRVAAALDEVTGDGTGNGSQTVEEAFANGPRAALQPDKGPLVLYDAAEQLVYIDGFSKNTEPSNGNVAASYIAEAMKLPVSPLKALVLDDVLQHKHAQENAARGAAEALLQALLDFYAGQTLPPTIAKAIENRFGMVCDSKTQTETDTEKERERENRAREEGERFGEGAKALTATPTSGVPDSGQPQAAEPADSEPQAANDDQGAKSTQKATATSAVPDNGAAGPPGPAGRGTRPASGLATTKIGADACRAAGRDFEEGGAYLAHAFERFMTAFARERGRPAAEAQWAAMFPEGCEIDRGLVETIIAGAAAEAVFRKTEHAPHPRNAATFLRDKGWLDLELKPYLPASQPDVDPARQPWIDRLMYAAEHARLPDTDFDIEDCPADLREAVEGYLNRAKGERR